MHFTCILYNALMVLSSPQSVVYATLDPKTPPLPPPKIQDGERVTYVSVWADVVVPLLPSDTKKKAGKQDCVMHG